MKRDFIPGAEVRLPLEGGMVDCWVPSDEAARLRREARDAEWRDSLPGAGLSSVPLSDAEIDAMNWQVELEARIHADRVHAEAAHAVANWDVEGAALMLGAPPESVAALACDLGLVSVSTKHGERAQRLAKRVETEYAPRPLPPTKSQLAAVQAAGGFIPGGDEARMAKLRRAVGFAARGHGADRAGFRPMEVRMLTLTYAVADGWEPSQVRSLCNLLRDWHKRHGVKFRYVWVAELQDGKRTESGRGRQVIHYHIAMWVPVGTPHLPKPDVEGWWVHGATNIKLATSAVGYLMSYLKKGNCADFWKFPVGARLYSVGGLDKSTARARRWLGLPGFVQSLSSYMDKWVRAPIGQGGWLSPGGVHYPSEFKRVLIARVPCLMRVLTHERDMDASGPFSWLSDASLLKGLSC